MLAFFTLFHTEENPTKNTKAKSNSNKEADSLKIKQKVMIIIKPELLNTFMNEASVFHVAQTSMTAKGCFIFPHPAKNL